MMRSIWKVLSGFGLATILLVLLALLTWLATLEMVEAGLLATLQKYFHWTSWYVLARLEVPWLSIPLVIPLPGGYWVCALLLVNMICGGLIRARKGWKTVGVLIAHFGIIFMIAAGGVAQLFEKRGVMFLFEGNSADYAVSLSKPTLEIFEIVDGEVADPVTVVTPDALRGMGRGDGRVVRVPSLPFDLELVGWMKNVAVRPASSGQAGAVDGWFLRELDLEKEGELNAPGCYARVLQRDGSKGEPFILAVAPPNFVKGVYAPQVIESEGRTFAIRMAKETIPVPLDITLNKAIAEYYPGTMKPKHFASEVTIKADDGVPVDATTLMNQPIRRDGYTFFQRTMSSGPQSTEGPRYSGLEVVSNPADKWPEYSLYVVTFGLFVHFITMLGRFLFRGSKTPKSQLS